MNEAAAIKALTKKLEDSGFYIKKLADRTTRGLPDSFICAYRKGIFIEFKYVELKKEFPRYFTQWTKVKTGINSLQLNTMCELNSVFLARYIICYRVGNVTRYALISPHTLRNSFHESIPVPILCLSFQELFQQLEILLQVSV